MDAVRPDDVILQDVTPIGDPRCAGELAITAAIEGFVSGPLKGELALMLMRER